MAAAEKPFTRDPWCKLRSHTSDHLMRYMPQYSKETKRLPHSHLAASPPLRTAATALAKTTAVPRVASALVGSPSNATSMT